MAIRDRIARAERHVREDRPADWPPGDPRTWTDEQLREVVDRYDPGLLDRIAAMSDGDLLDALEGRVRTRHAKPD